MKNSLAPRSFVVRARKVLSTVIQPAVLGLLLAQAQAGNTWDGGGGDNNWGTGANWNPDGTPAPGSGNDLFFAGSTRLSPFNNYTAFDDWRNITFNAGASSFNITGNAIDLFGKIENLSSNTQTFGLGSIALNSATANEFNPVNGNLTITSANIFTNGNQLKVFGNNGFTLSFAAGTNIQGSGSLAINQNSTVVFNSAHSYTGDTFVNAGKLQFNTGATAASAVIRIGDTSGSVNAEVDLIAAAGGQTLTNTIVARAGSSGVRTLDSQNTSGTNTLSGAVALDAALTVKQSAGGTLSFAGGSFDVKAQTLTVNTAGTVSISEALTSSLGAGGTLVKQGSGTLILSNTSNSYTGTNAATLNANGTQIAGGTLAIADDGSLGVVPSGAYNNVQFTGSGTLQDNGSSVALNANRNISIASGATATFNSSIGTDFTVNGIVNGSGGLVNVTGAGGTVILAGNNSYTGATTVTSGTLRVDHDNGLGTTAAGTTVNSGASLRINGVTIAETIVINGSGDGGVGAIVNHSAGTNIFTGQVTAATNSLINANGGTLVFDGGIVKDGTTLTLSGGFFNIDTVGISGASANSDLIVDNATVALNAASTYNGPTTIRNGGTLNANITSALPTSTRSAMILDDTGSGSSTLVIGSGTNNEIASLTGAASSILSLTTSSSLTIGTGSGTTTFAGTITGGPGTPIMKDGASTQILTGDSSTYQGVISISAGVLEANNTTGSASGTAGVSVSSGGTLAGTGRIEASAAAGFVFINGDLVVGSTIGAPAVADFEIATTGFALGTTLSVNSRLTMELFTGAGLGDNSGISTSADRLKIVGNLDIVSGAKFVLANPNAMSGWAIGDRWRVFDWSGLTGITGSFASIDTTLPTLGAGMYWDTSDLFTTSGAFSGTIDIEAVPEPGSLLVGIFCTLSVAMRRRRGRSAV